MKTRKSSDGNLKKINDLFSIYRKRLKPPQQSVKKIFVEVVEELLQISIKEEKIEYSVHNKTLHLKISGMIKSEVKLHEKEILAHLEARLGDLGAPKSII